MVKALERASLSETESMSAHLQVVQMQKQKLGRNSEDNFNADQTFTETNMNH